MTDSIAAQDAEYWLLCAQQHLKELRALIKTDATQAEIDMKIGRIETCSAYAYTSAAHAKIDIDTIKIPTV